MRIIIKLKCLTDHYKFRNLLLIAFSKNFLKMQNTNAQTTNRHNPVIEDGFYGVH
jgi:hypothetical protein